MCLERLSTRKFSFLKSAHSEDRDHSEEQGHVYKLQVQLSWIQPLLDNKDTFMVSEAVSITAASILDTLNHLHGQIPLS